MKFEQKLKKRKMSPVGPEPWLFTSRDTMLPVVPGGNLLNCLRSPAINNGRLLNALMDYVCLHNQLRNAYMYPAHKSFCHLSPALLFLNKRTDEDLVN